MGFTGFDWVSTGFYWVWLGLTGFQVGFTGFYWVLLGFTGFYWVLLGFTGLYWVLLGCTGLYWILLGFTWFYFVPRARRSRTEFFSLKNEGLFYYDIFFWKWKKKIDQPPPNQSTPPTGASHNKRKKKRAQESKNGRNFTPQKKRKSFFSLLLLLLFKYGRLPPPKKKDTRRQETKPKSRKKIDERNWIFLRNEKGKVRPPFLLLTPNQSDFEIKKNGNRTSKKKKTGSDFLVYCCRLRSFLFLGPQTNHSGREMQREGWPLFTEFFYRVSILFQRPTSRKGNVEPFSLFIAAINARVSYRVKFFLKIFLPSFLGAPSMSIKDE